MKYEWKISPTAKRSEDVSPKLLSRLNQLESENKLLKMRCASLEHDLFGSIGFLLDNASEYIVLKLADGLNRKWSVRNGKREHGNER